MIIQPFPSGPFATNAYVIACPQTRQAVIIDPAPGSFSKLADFIAKNSLTPVAIWLTHSHWDHIVDTAAVKAQYSIPVAIHALDVSNLEHPGADKLPCWVSIEGVTPDWLLKENDHLACGDLDFEVIHTPGHTPGGVCFYCPKEGVLISGDTLFKGTIGNLSFPTCQPEAMWISLDKLAKLPGHVRVFPGHGSNTTIGQEVWLPKARQIFDK